MKVILINGKAGSGKDTLGGNIDMILRYMYKHTAVVAHFADYLKDSLIHYFNWDLEKDENGRSLLQNVGQKVKDMYPNFWAEGLCRIMKCYEDNWEYLIIPDWRYKDEYDTIIKYFDDVVTIRVNCDNIYALTEKQLNHKSENDLEDFNFDYVVKNEKNGISEFFSLTHDLLATILNICYNDYTNEITEDN